MKRAGRAQIENHLSLYVCAKRTTHCRILFDQLLAARHAEAACGLRGAIQSFRPNSLNNQQYIQD